MLYLNNKKKLVILLGISIIVVFLMIFLNSHNGTNFLWNISQKGTWLLPLIIATSLVDSINPCAISILLVSIGFLVVLGRSRLNILQIGFSYIFGIFIVYFLIGIGLLRLLHLFSTPHFMGKLGAVILLIFGIVSLIDALFPKFPIRLKIPSVSHSLMAKLIEKGKLPFTFALGVLVGLCEFPCTGGPYVTATTLLKEYSTFLSGLVYLILYNLIFVSPLILIVLISGNKETFGRIQEFQKRNKKTTKLITGILMIALSLVIFSIVF